MIFINLFKVINIYIIYKSFVNVINMYIYL